MDITNPNPLPNPNSPITMEGHVYLIGLFYAARTRTMMMATDIAHTLF
jgi:hypothetical protein